MVDYKPEQVLPHASYLSNIGTADSALYEKARSALLEECKRVEQLGLKYLNIHPGSTAKKCTKEESIKHIADAINYIHDHTSYMTIVLENTAGGGGTVGVNFKELKSIIDQVQKKDRIGVCIDTCHAFASGINIASKSGIATMLRDFDETLGLSYLKAMHLNDSTGILGSNRDVHQPLGEGQIGLDAFRQIMNEDRLRGIPLILETPWGEGSYDESNGWAKEIAMLRSFVGLKEVETKKKGIAGLFEKKGKKKMSEGKKSDEKKEKNDTKKDKKEKKTKVIKKSRKSKSSSDSEFTESSVSSKNPFNQITLKTIPLRIHSFLNKQVTSSSSSLLSRQSSPDASQRTNSTSQRKTNPFASACTSPSPSLIDRCNCSLAPD